MISFDEAVEIVSRTLGYRAKIACDALLEAMERGELQTMTSSIALTGANEITITTGLLPKRKQPIDEAELANFIARRETLSAKATPIVTKHKLKNRTRELDAEIALAMQKASDPNDYHAVWNALKELALSGTPPFTGVTDYKALEYTTATNSVVKFTKNALRKRLNPEAR